VAALALPQSSRAQSVWQTTFDHATFPDQHTAQKGAGHHWEVSDYFQDYPGPNNLPCVDGSCGLGTFGNWYTSLGGANQSTGDDVIHSNANNPNGGGGKGFRHWRGNASSGQNDNGGGMIINVPVQLNEFWMRFYMRYQAGFTWGPTGIADPGYTKDLRNESQAGWVFGIQGGHSWGISWTGGNVTSSKSWQSTMGGMKGDGVWHCYEFHWQNGANSRIEMWVDNAQVLNTIANTPSDQTRTILVGSNQNAVGDSNGRSTSNGGTPTDWYTDYDDIAISTTGRIGCGSFFVLPSPRNLRVQ
jgi:hypothetical protein